MSSYLVTGAAGFVGSALASRLLKEGHEVITIDDLSTGYESALPKRINFIQGDCSDLSSFKTIQGKKIDAVFHIAGQSSGEVSFEDPIKDIKANTESTLQLLEFCVKNECSRFIYASTMSVYGTNDQIKVKETENSSPKSFYAVGKLASEKYMDIYAGYGVKTSALRLFNVFGPGQNMSNLKQGMLSIYLEQFLNSEEVIVKGSQDRYRDFIYIDDVIEGFMRVLNRQNTFSKIINLGTGKKTTVKALLQMIEDKLLTEKKIRFVEGTPGDLFGITADTTLMNKLLGDWPKTSVLDGLENMINHINTSNKINESE
ncbi:MAG: NAD-dependent epimerase/dehydratase family protein [Gammaproteobacteria bacterium]|tara:strand:+ start:2334 stop:3278 length:945 start_codon:yes stop_codon:yes gene_type:complete